MKSIFLMVLIALGGTLILCANPETVNDPEVQESAQSKNKVIKILALGDSYTIGEGVLLDQRWPVQLVALLKDQGFEVQEPTIVARTGWTTGNLQAALKSAELEIPYDFVTLLIGVNDQFRGLSESSYKKNFTQLLDQAIEYAGGISRRVIVLSIPDYSVTPFGQRFRPQETCKALDRFNQINAKISQEKSVAYIDITPHSRKAKTKPSLLASDGLHPSAAMYYFWAHNTFVEIWNVLSKDTKK